MYKLTVAVTTYNRANYLIQMLDSILLQSYKDFYVIISDNCSNDNTTEVVKPYLSDSRFEYIRHEPSLKAHFNYLFDICKTEYLIIVHDDDTLQPDLIKEQINILDSNKDVSFVCTSMNYMNEHGKFTKYSDIGTDFLYTSKNYIKVMLKYKQFKKYNNINFPTIMYRVNIINSNNIRFDTSIGGACDVYFYLELNQLKYNFYCINKPLYNYRLHTGQDSYRTLYLLPFLRIPVYNFLVKNNYSKSIIKTWIHYVDLQILIEINKQYDKKWAYHEIKNRILFHDNKDKYLLMGVKYLIYTPPFIQKLLKIPLKVIKKILMLFFI